ncbi:MAG: hypothetical protein JNN12_02250 [Bacteroidetes Order II. Incertae sedis bacterium]|nr:hypothetical protein [Bacteroidetes Order II. bacterium]
MQRRGLITLFRFAPLVGFASCGARVLRFGEWAVAVGGPAGGEIPRIESV